MASLPWYRTATDIAGAYAPEKLPRAAAVAATVANEKTIGTVDATFVLLSFTAYTARGNTLSSNKDACILKLALTRAIFFRCCEQQREEFPKDSHRRITYYFFRHLAGERGVRADFVYRCKRLQAPLCLGQSFGARVSKSSLEGHLWVGGWVGGGG